MDITTLYWAIYLIAIAQRLSELVIAKRHTRWMEAHGGIHIDEPYYKWVIIVMILFFIGLPIEHVYRHTSPSPLWPLLTIAYLITQGLRYWTMRTLGVHWNTEIWILPTHPLVKKGPYRFLSHPNYLIVVLELIILAEMIQARWIGAITLFGYAAFLRRRIPTENKALNDIQHSHTTSP